MVEYGVIEIGTNSITGLMGYGIAEGFKSILEAEQERLEFLEANPTWNPQNVQVIQYVVEATRHVT